MVDSTVTKKRSSAVIGLCPFRPRKRHCRTLRQESVLKDLTIEQRQVVDLVFKERTNLFLTGAAGTGKSHLLRFLGTLCHHEIRMILTASTSIAAREINGMTFHSCFGLTPILANPKTSIDQAVKVASGSQSVQARLFSADLLVVDEISLISAQLLSKADGIARVTRNRRDIPFGGLQLLFIGDFFQLPPVEAETLNEGRFSFESESWTTAIETVAELRTMMRQLKSPEFFEMLSSLREKTCSEKAKRYFDKISYSINNNTNDTLVQLSISDQWTCLFLTNKEVQRHNNQCHAQLIQSNKEQTDDDVSVVKYTTITAAIKEEESTINRQQPSWIPSEFLLTVNSPVIISLSHTTYTITSSDRVTLGNHHNENVGNEASPKLSLTFSQTQFIPNGTCGKIIDFVDYSNLAQITKDRFLTDLYENEFGTLNGPKESRIRKESISKLSALRRFFDSCGWKFPLLEYELLNSSKRIHTVILPHFIEDYKASYLQLPLLLSWGMTIHRSQGLTLSKVCVILNPNSRRFLTSGSLYVALSRVRHPDQLKIFGQLPSMLMPNLKVRAYYNSLQEFDTEEIILD